eukprot:sb/3467243/
MDNISDILSGGGGRNSRAVSSETSPGLVRERSPYQQSSKTSERSEEDVVSMGIGEVAMGMGLVVPVKQQPVHLLYDKEQLTDVTPKPDHPPQLAFEVEVIKKPTRAGSTSSSSGSSKSGRRSRSSRSSKSLSHTSEVVNVLHSASESSRHSLVDDLLVKYETPQHHTDDEEEDQPCMVPVKTPDRTSPNSSTFMERVRSTSLGNSDKFIDEDLYNDSVAADVGEERDVEEEEEEVEVGYMTHSSHYSETAELDNLSNISEEQEETAAEVVPHRAVDGSSSQVRRDSREDQFPKRVGIRRMEQCW